MNTDQVGERTVVQVGDTTVNVRWDDSQMRTSYSNVCNVTGTREEITLLLGIHQAWRTGVQEVVVQLHDRIIVSPYAAKRLSLLLTRVLREYESRYGVLPVEPSESGGLGGSLPTG
jgi:hypothetical protein